MAVAKTDGSAKDLAKLLEERRDQLLGEYKITASTATVTKDTTEEGESLLSLACSAGYYELAQVK